MLNFMPAQTTAIPGSIYHNRFTEGCLTPYGDIDKRPPGRCVWNPHTVKPRWLYLANTAVNGLTGCRFEEGCSSSAGGWPLGAVAVWQSRSPEDSPWRYVAAVACRALLRILLLGHERVYRAPRAVPRRYKRLITLSSTYRQWWRRSRSLI